MRIKVSSSLVLGKMKNSDYLRFQKNGDREELDREEASCLTTTLVGGKKSTGTPSKSLDGFNRFRISWGRQNIKTKHRNQLELQKVSLASLAGMMRCVISRPLPELLNSLGRHLPSV